MWWMECIKNENISDQFAINILRKCIEAHGVSGCVIDPAFERCPVILAIKANSPGVYEQMLAKLAGK